MAEFKVAFKCEGEAFEENKNAEIARILIDLGNRVKSGVSFWCEDDVLPIVAGNRTLIRDINGNTIGEAEYIPANQYPPVPKEVS